MSEAEILENNKAIAEFMEIHITMVGLRRNIMQKSYYVTELKYHTSWDWLMPVVEKIEGTGEKQNLSIQIVDNSCSITTCEKKYASTWNFIANETADTKLSATYQAVCEFIKQQKI